MKHADNHPPKIFMKLFRWLCHPSFQEEIEGDLIERYNYFSEHYGEKKAKWLFIKEVFLLIRPNLVGNINQLINLNSNFMTTKNRRLLGILIAIPLLLLIPFIAMQFSKEVNWGILDFIVMAVLLLVTGILCEFVLRKVKTIQNRLLLCSVVIILFLLVWAELAVGIF
jgi:hypothetical protein